MLFKRLYNWIRYKTLPPSLLFKNRLYIERDSKTRRIVSNFGLTFRNSKWSNYARTDINLNLKEKFIITFIIIFIIITLSGFFYYYTFLYNNNLWANSLFFCYWSLKDLLLYYLFLFLTSLPLLIDLIFDKSYLILMNWTFQTAYNSSTFNTNKSNNPLGQSKYLYYTWLKTTDDLISNELINTFSFIENPIFNPSDVSSNFFSSSFQLNKNLFRLTSKSLTTTKPLLSDYELLGFYFFLFKKQKQFTTYTDTIHITSLLFLKQRFNWKLSLLVNMFEKYPNTLQNQTHYFYNNSLNFTNLNNLLLSKNFTQSLTHSLTNQLTVIKSSKFLYNYSFLHKTILVNSHKLTMVKKLFSSGFYDKKLIEKNLWASDFFNKMEPSKNLLESELKLIYTQFFNTNFSTYYLFNNDNLNKNKYTFKLFSSYETSYFWFLKRFFLFNNLQTNLINFNFKPLNHSNTINSLPLNLIFLKVNYLLKADLILNINFNNFFSTGKLLPGNVIKSDFIPNKDNLLLYSESDLFSLDDELILSNLFISTNSSNNPYFSSYETLNMDASSVHKFKECEYHPQTTLSNSLGKLGSDVGLNSDLHTLYYPSINMLILKDLKTFFNLN